MGTGLPCGGSGHRVLIENSEYWLRNYGDVAMLEVTVRRLRARWPLARIGIMTESPALVAAYFPGAVGITVGDRDPWGDPGPSERLAAALGPAVVGPVAMTWLRSRAWLLPRAIRVRDRLRKRAENTATDSVPVQTGEAPRIERRHPGAARAVREASLVVGLGGGYLTDADIPQAGRVLDLLEYASDTGIPTALVGQGIGPLRDPELAAQAARVLAKLPLIALRERRRGPALLESFGVPPGAVTVTGDDAIELARAARSAELGGAIGVCLRVARYAPVARRAQDGVGIAVRAAAAEFRTWLVPLIIAETPGSPDRATTVPLVRGSANPAEPLARFVRPADVAAQLAQCRVLVTGAYHLAVFALSQGIPVVALTSTEYYDDKFLGLDDMFKGGVRLVHFDDPDFVDRLGAAITAAWAEAPEVRDSLRARADEQVASSQQVYERLFELLERTHIEHA
ncbi:polysaccharide pyruvyl transferase family protein [Nocardia sp. SYP-A9097]|uniref:polysaccharide pyruvyl transferase family protein n=1 Tax=Nocardia sp. SYP-A9097 TaxID=2663237 RepID=UPI00129B695C|nr:polysaccharide pyruvyl transferase family protein [Nocardia sp. SYP-A9097]MRH88258.1 polysaccharide pyruvyl transferase family protein [Nocardia sp. SYP-A9097]